MTQKVQDNKKIIMVCSLVVIAIAAIVLSYVYFFRNPGIQKANDQIGAADLELAQGNDSTAMVQYMAAMTQPTVQPFKAQSSSTRTGNMKRPSNISTNTR